MKIHYRSTVRAFPVITMAIVVLVFIAIILSVARPASAADPVITGGSPIIGQTDIFIPVTGIVIQGDIAGTTTVSVRVQSGTLRMTTTTGLVFSGPETGRTITFDGTKQDLNAALASLEYRANEPGAVSVTATLGAPGIVYYPGNGHIYEVVTVNGGITWEEARVAAEARTMNGADGYLATISEQPENDYITQRLVGDGWFGANDITAEGQWEWVTGPEADTLFWVGNGSGTLQPGQFANWADGIEPNDFGPGEDCAQFYGDGRGWNDLPCSGSLGSYVVEYGAPGNMPVVPSETVVPAETTTPDPEVVSLSTCQQFFDDYVDSNQHRYDTITLTEDLDCAGEEITGLFSDTESFYDEDEGYTIHRPIAFRGTFDGNGHTIRNLTIAPKTNEDDNLTPTGLFGALDSTANIRDLTLENVTVSGNECVGGFVGTGAGFRLENLTFDGTVQNSDDEYGSGLGGIVGCVTESIVETQIENVSHLGSVSAEESDDSGGIVGRISLDGQRVNDDPLSLWVEGVTVEGSVNGGSSVGGVIGDAEVEGSLSTIRVTDVVSEGVSATYGNVGGVFGSVEVSDGSLTVEDVLVNGPIESSGNEVGGAIGAFNSDYASILIEDITINSSVEGGEDRVGGIIGGAYDYIEEENPDYLIQRVFVTGDVIGRNNVGGLIGEASGYNDFNDEIPSIVIRQASAIGSVTATEYGYAGGLLGYASGATVEESYASGSVTAQNSDRAGGLIGYADRVVLDNVYARGNVSSAEGSAGGLIGELDSTSTITNAYSTGTVSMTQPDDMTVGGLIGLANDEAEHTVTSSYWDRTSSRVSSSAYGNSRTSTQMKQRTNYVEWDFDTIWSISATSNNGYPCLQWTQSCQPDGDLDGVADETEQAAPNNGDANNDGVGDALQSHVTSLPGVDTSYVSLVVDEVCQLQTVSVTSESDNRVSDSAYRYNNGFVNFNADCGTPGYTVTVTLYFYGQSGETVLRKHFPDQNAYMTIRTAIITSEVVDGQPVTRASYTVTDGGTLDIDGAVNGVIVDPIGLGQLVVGAPNTGVFVPPLHTRMLTL